MEKDPAMWGKRACVVCGRLRSRRSKHCKDCGRCVSDFDHHCPWLGNCVGSGNLRFFLRFLFRQSSSLIAALWLTWDLLGVYTSDWQLSDSMFSFHFRMLFGFNIFWLLFVSCMLFSQFSLAAAGLTAHEAEQSDVCACPASCREAYR